MTSNTFIYNSINNLPKNGNVTWQSPSNIALIKYWGKKPVQLPANSSISFTLKNCYTETSLEFEKSNNFSIKLFVDNKPNTSFLKKINTFLDRIKPYCPYVFDYSLIINTSNTFPHSSGIASSASGFSALALCIVSIERKVNNFSDEEFYRKVSFISRLGSGSACRSIYAPMATWGKHNKIKDSNDIFAICNNKIHKIFKDFQDTILIVDKGEKKVSSSVGHSLMNKHPFSENRFIQAKDNMSKLIIALEAGDIDAFINITENEAMTLHAMMMTSDPGFILFSPKTIAVINKIKELRERTKLPICFTLDAGANVHLLYPYRYKKEVIDIIKSDFLVYCQNDKYICDEIGSGSLQIKK